MVASNHSPVHNIDKLRGAENYATWKVEMKSCLNRDGAWKVVCGREIKKSSLPAVNNSSSTSNNSAMIIPAAAAAAAAAAASVSTASDTNSTARKVTVLEDDIYNERNETAYDTIVLGVTQPQLQHIQHCPDDGKTAWEIFERLYDASHAQRPTRLSLRRQLYKSSPMEPGESIRDFINRKIAISEKLLDLGTLVDESELADCILMDVAEEFQGTVGMLERRGGYGLSDVRGALAQEELERRTRNLTTGDQADVKREPGLAAQLLPAPPAPLQALRKPSLAMSADHPIPIAARPPNTPTTIARQGSRNGKRPHQDDGDEDLSGADQTSPVSVDGKKKASSEKEDFKKPRVGIRNGGRKQKIQIRYIHFYGTVFFLLIILQQRL
jgi:hypothetical protein